VELQLAQAVRLVQVAHWYRQGWHSSLLVLLSKYLARQEHVLPLMVRKRLGLQLVQAEGVLQVAHWYGQDWQS
jgi:hypothetical protein